MEVFMNLIGKAADPDFWCETVRNAECYKDFREMVESDWEKHCEGKQIEELKYSDFKRFFVDGNRSVYEGQYFKRRAMILAASGMALIYPEDDKYINYLADAVFAICNEYTWCLPAHHPRLDENNSVFIDLFASETGFALAEIYTILGERLDPLIRERIKAEIDRRIIAPFLAGTHYWWASGCTNNWAAVCGGSVGCTFMLMRPELFSEVKPRLDKIMESYLSGFEDDGYCAEGTGYWHYGFGFFTVYADMLKTFTEGREDYFVREKVKTVATFIQKMFLTGSAGVSFADGGGCLSYHIGLVHYLKGLYPDDVKVYSRNFGVYKHGARYCLFLRAASWLNEEYFEDPDENSPAEYYGEHTQWLVKRAEAYGFAAKGGHNAEHHNHDDVGSFIFAKNGRHLLTDIGSGTYCRQYFSGATRYDFIECSSLGHSVPIFGDVIQKTGKSFAAQNCVYRDGYFSADIASAYGDGRIKHAVREFFLGDSEVTLRDSFECEGIAEITERIVAAAEPRVVSEGKIEIEDCELLYDSKYSPAITPCETSRKRTVWFIDFNIPSDARGFELKIK